MSLRPSRLSGCLATLLIAVLPVLCSCGGGASAAAPPSPQSPPPSTYVLAVQTSGSGTVTSNPSGIDCGATCNGTFSAQSTVMLTATPSQGFVFSGWGGGCTGTGTCAVALQANISVTATFTAVVMYQVSVTDSGTGSGTVSSSPAGIKCGTTCIASFPAGTGVVLTATPGNGSIFAGWGGGCTGTGTCAVTLQANISVTATFTPVLMYQVSVTDTGTGSGTVTSSPSGISCGAICIASFPVGTPVTLTANPAVNSEFTGWSGACSGNGACILNGTGDAAVTAIFTATAYTLTVTLPGNGAGNVSSSPAGISCPPTCNASYGPGSQVTLTTTPGGNAYFAGWGGDCSGTGACNVTMDANESVSSTINLWPLNHIIFMAQENRSLDHYFGAMRAYWAANGYPDQAFDGLPQFNPQQGIPPLYGPPPSNPGCDPNSSGGPPFTNCTVDDNSPLITSFHLITQCIENPFPWWNPSHYNLDWANPLTDPSTPPGPPMNGFVSEDAHYSQSHPGDDNGHFYDTIGMRVMGYYDWTDLNYYYFMATNFATSDRFFSPTMTLTEPNRHYLIAATSQGYIFPVHHSDKDPELTAQTIFQVLQAAGISWKIYVNPQNTPCTPPYQTSCLVTYDDVYLKDFEWGYHNLSYPQNLGTIGPPGTCGSSPCDFENDLANGTLPQVVQIEPASPASLDEHGSDKDQYPVAIQEGARYVSGLMNALMQSSSWKDSVFILTYDEMGGIYDHVPPQPAVSPDGIAPQDLEPGDLCYNQTGPTCDFTWTGYRIPLTVVSPYTKKNYVSHTVMDSTAILKLIETRFGLPALTARDAAQADMSEFFDFNNPPWMTPPTPPVQDTSAPCYINQLP